MLSVIYKPYMLNVSIMLSVIMLSVVAPVNDEEKSFMQLQLGQTSAVFNVSSPSSSDEVASGVNVLKLFNSSLMIMTIKLVRLWQNFSFWSIFLPVRLGAANLSQTLWVICQEDIISFGKMLLLIVTCTHPFTYPLKWWLHTSFDYSKMMFLGLSQVYYWRCKCNTHNNYNYSITTKLNYIWKLFTTEREAPSKVGLGLR